MPEKFSAADISFKEMSEDEAVKAFQDDGYFDYQKRRMRYRSMSRDSSWATAPATMFVAYYEDKPVGVIGFSKHKGKLLGAGIHVRKEFRGRGLSGILVDKIIAEKGSNTLYVNIANDRIASTYRNRGFNDMNISELPEDSQRDLEGLTYADQVQKWMYYTQPKWKDILKFYPTGDFSNLGQYQDTQDEHITHPAKADDSGEVLVIFSSHYLKRHDDKEVRRKIITDEEIQKMISLGKPRFWAYIYPDLNNFEYVIGQFASGNQRINRYKKKNRDDKGTVKDFLDALNRANNTNYTKILNLYHISGGRKSGGYPTNAGKQLPIVYENTETRYGEKPGHRLSRGKGQKAPDFNPFAKRG